MKTLINFWSEQDSPRPLGVVRILLGLVLVFEFIRLGWLGLVGPLFLDQQHGGWVDLSVVAVGAYGWLPTDPWVGYTTYALLLVSSFTFFVGWFTRSSTLVLLVTWTAWRAAHPTFDRAIDLLVRDALFILVLSGAGRWGSLDARWSTGRWTGDERPIPAWPRYLLLGQLVLMYTTAGLQKTGSAWWPAGDSLALFTVLQDPAITRFSFGWLANEPFLTATKLATTATVVWQITYPLVMVFAWFGRTAERPGVVRAWSNRLRLHSIWVGTGVLFHVGLMVTMTLGMFPYAMLAMYPAWWADRSGSRDA